MKKPFDKKTSTSWEPVEKWYKGTVGSEGHYYHQRIVIPGVLKLLDFASSPILPPSLLDLACGNGVLSHQLPANCEYEGFDLSPSLIKAAKKENKIPHHHFTVCDVTKALPLEKKQFSHTTIILALQNIKMPSLAIQNASKHLMKGGKLVMVLNHPCFRIPRQSSWQIDEQQKLQYRRIDKYASPMEIPIHAEPSKGTQSATTWSFHHPLQSYSQWLFEAGFTIELIEEWHSDKVSTGKNAKMENRSRTEIPLFMAIRAVKL